jgi:arsenate reductase
MDKLRAVFICIHNSGRSQMGEALLRHLAGDRFEVHSAGLEAGRLHPLVVRVLDEIGVSTAGQYAKPVADYIARGETFDYVITVCDETSAERCPVFPGKHVRLHWSFPDPNALHGEEAAKLAAIRDLRDAMQAKIEAWLASLTA